MQGVIEINDDTEENDDDEGRIAGKQGSKGAEKQGSRGAEDQGSKEQRSMRADEQGSR